VPKFFLARRNPQEKLHLKLKACKLHADLKIIFRVFFGDPVLARASFMGQEFTRKYIYDVAQRILHWWLALSTLALMVSGFLASKLDSGSDQVFIWTLHISAGKVLVVGVVGRLLWGIIGPRHARFAAFIHIKAWIETVKSKKMLSADGEFGHHPQASLSYLGFYGLIIFMCASGFSLAGIIHGEGPLAEALLDEFAYLGIIRDAHEIGFWAIAFFIVTHIGALMFHEWHDKIPLAQSIISGFQYRTTKKQAKEKKNSDHK
jgi:Ni/Fe-hydrogenase 1 B-type cytochrome subunit